MRREDQRRLSLRRLDHSDSLCSVNLLSLLICMPMQNIAARLQYKMGCCLGILETIFLSPNLLHSSKDKYPFLCRNTSGWAHRQSGKAAGALYSEWTLAASGGVSAPGLLWRNDTEYVASIQLHPAQGCGSHLFDCPSFYYTGIHLQCWPCRSLPH